MWRNGETAALMNHIADFPRWFSLQVRQLRTDAEEMTIGGGDLYSGQKEGIIDRQTTQPHQTFLKQVIDRVAGVMIGDGDTVQTLHAGGRNQVFRARNTISGKKRMRVQIYVQRHGYASVKSLKELQGQKGRGELRSVTF